VATQIDRGGDGRRIALTYVPGSDRVASVFDGTRTWTYGYGSGLLPSLDTVTLPDQSQWHLLGLEALQRDLTYLAPPRCDDAGTLELAALTGRLVHPSGAIGDFTLTPTMHGRAGVGRQCLNAGTVGEYASFPKDYATHALTRKIISGPGLPPLQWTTSFAPSGTSWGPCSGCVATKVVEVTDPAGDKTRYTFGTLFRKTEGQLQQTEVIDAAGGSLRTTVTRYRDPAAGPFPNPMGVSDQGRGDGDLGSRLQVLEQRTISQQGIDFTWKTNDDGIDTMGRAVDVTRSSTLGHSRKERTSYFDHPGKWVLGQVESVTETTTGAVSVKNTYSTTTATLTSIDRFGRRDQSMTYYADGTLKTRSDGADHTTSFSNYKRGIAQSVSYADNSAESAVVDNIGVISSLTDAAGNEWKYGYDPAGRLHRITRSAGDLVAWRDTVIDFAPAGASEYGLDASHWRQSVTTGDATSVTYMDGLWRPVLTRVYDAANEDATRKMVARRFDHRGQTTYESYPQRAIGDAGERPAGVATEYDALGRVITSHADSELGPLTTATDYLAGFRKRVTNPRGFASTTSYQAFDEPAEDAATVIEAPANLTVGIARDMFGKPLALTRSGDGASATRSYVYDPNQRLCKTIEPETGATVQDYDKANNVAWRASGLALPGATCDRTSVTTSSKTTFAYDLMNRLTGTTYADGSPAIARTYYADGVIKTVSSGGATWTTSYNKLRLPTAEVLSFEGANYTLGRTYDANGNLNRLDYPSAAEGNPITARSVAYNPNALGEASQAGSFATGIGYHPNGAIAAFTYGNGKRHTLAQNLRGLPEVASDAGVLDDRYSYDQNGNVAGIEDRLPAKATTRTLGYDLLDRLASAAAPDLWSSATYLYDVLDNLRNSTVGSRVSHYDYDERNRLKTLSSTVPGYGFGYGYDARGNITSRGAQTYVFDQANRMTAAIGRDTYRYDGYGHRLKTTAADGTVTISVYSPAGQLLYVTQRGGPRAAATTQYIYLHRHQVAEVKR
jgi:YD repeat-containing protein